jgi:hypothetical protein
LPNGGAEQLRPRGDKSFGLEPQGSSSLQRFDGRLSALPDDFIQTILVLLLRRYPLAIFKSSSKSLGEAKAQLRRWAGTTFNQFLDITLLNIFLLLENFLIPLFASSPFFLF